MAKKKALDPDVAILGMSEKTKRIIQCFLEIECDPSLTCTPQQAKTSRKKIVEEVGKALANVICYDQHAEEPKRPVPLWHKLFIAGHDVEGRPKRLRYLLRSLARQIRTSDNRPYPYWLY